MAETFKFKTYITGNDGVIESPWVTGQTMTDVLRVRNLVKTAVDPNKVYAYVRKAVRYQGVELAFKDVIQGHSNGHDYSVAFWIVREGEE